MFVIIMVDLIFGMSKIAGIATDTIIMMAPTAAAIWGDGDQKTQWVSVDSHSSTPAG